MVLFKRSRKQDQEVMISRPEPPIKTIYLVVLRSITVTYMLLSAILMHLAVMYRPWKQEWKGKPSVLFEISIWSVCRVTPKGTKCYEGELDDAPGWFMAFRSFFTLSVVLQYIGAFFPMIMLMITKNTGRRRFWIPALISLASVIMTLCGMLILTGYRKFEFLEKSRMYRMGWKFEQVEISRKWKWPYYLSWWNFGIALVGCLICLFTHFKDSKWTNYMAKESLRRQANKMMT